jgi:hypothetical protein
MAATEYRTAQSTLLKAAALGCLLANYGRLNLRREVTRSSTFHDRAQKWLTRNRSSEISLSETRSMKRQITGSVIAPTSILLCTGSTKASGIVSTVAFRNACILRPAADLMLDQTLEWESFIGICLIGEGS